MIAPPAIVDLGRGPQLAGTRITVQDLLPYFQAGCTPGEIAQAMPVTPEEIAVVRQYIDDHRDEVLEADQRIRARNVTRANPPQVEEILRQVRAERLALMASKQPPPGK
jgi:uncharacterized protein (DUF433 family)